MLFSNSEVAGFINDSFEPAWESLRPVPLVRIDFGNGNELKRTLHGNIATYVCTAEGEVLDALPGIYTPEVYLSRLNQLHLLANFVDQMGKENRVGRLNEYHASCGTALKNDRLPPRLLNTAGMAKAIIENRLKAILVPGGEFDPEVVENNAPPRDLKLESPDDLAQWKYLEEDTRLNDTGRRLKIHELLAESGRVQPASIVKRLYKEVLHTDLDDPYLGVAAALRAR